MAQRATTNRRLVWFARGVVLVALLLFGGASWCHGARSVVVRSRQGGFVTQNCETCGKPRALKRDEVPALTCQRCQIDLDQFTNAKKNYAYSCRQCEMVVALPDLVPSWSDLFEYQGYGIESDLVVSQQQWTHEQSASFIAKLRMSLGR